MQVMRENAGLSKEELVEVLHDRGYVDVTLRQVTNWRSRELLPPFDLEGASLGRAQGKSKSRWSNAEIIIEQSAWIIELLNLFGDYRHVYVPLWLLGYPVYLRSVRDALSESLERTIASVQRDCTADKNLEDVLSESASIFAAKLEKENDPLLHIPVDALDLILNIFMNPDYDFTDQGAFQAIQLWQEQCHQLQASRSKSGMQLGTADSIESLFGLASTIKRYLSITEIRRCVVEANYDDLRVVGRDITILRHMWLMFSKLLARELPDLDLPKELVLRLVLGMGRIAIYLDIALRSNGEGNKIDSLLSDGLAMFERVMDEKFGDAKSLVSTQTA